MLNHFNTDIFLKYSNITKVCKRKIFVCIYGNTHNLFFPWYFLITVQRHVWVEYSNAVISSNFLLPRSPTTASGLLQSINILRNQFKQPLFHYAAQPKCPHLTSSGNSRYVLSERLSLAPVCKTGPWRRLRLLILSSFIFLLNPALHLSCELHVL